MAKEIKGYPRILVLSNDCFSDSNSNGRTLKNFFVGYPKEKLAQFFLHGVPDLSVCDHYFNVSDTDALKAFLFRKPKEKKAQEQAVNVAGKKPSRTAKNMLLRDIVWNSSRWKKFGFVKWVENFSPELVLLQAGDCAFMCKLARKIAKQYKVPLVIYNSEEYYFKRYDYFAGKEKSSFFYSIYSRRFRKQFKKAISSAQISIYNSEELERAYDKEFALPSATVYTATGLNPLREPKEEGKFTVSYLGNLGVGRHEPLVEIAEILQEISKDVYLDVYGKIPNEQVQKAFESSKGIRYKGFVSYEDVVRVMKESSLLVHAESFERFARLDLRFAFSTKIADSLACGTAFLLYAPEELACSIYVSKNECAYFASNREDLRAVLKDIYTSQTEREKYIDRAIALAKENHDGSKNTLKFQEILVQAYKEGGKR